MKTAPVILLAAAAVSAAIAAAQSSPRATTEAYLAIPAFFDGLTTNGGSDDSLKPRFAAKLKDLCADSELLKWEAWLREMHFRGEASTEIENLRSVGTQPKIQLLAVTQDSARAVVELQTQMNYALGFSLFAVSELYRLYPITNIGVSEAEAQLKPFDPGSYTFTVRSQRRLELNLRSVDGSWKVTSSTVRILSAALSVIPPTAGR
jgi:hypothetical protein